MEAVKIDPQTIAVVFESKTTAKSNGNSNREYLTHPAFTFGDTKLNGMRVGKFETTGSISSPCTDEACATASLSIKPNLSSVRNKTISSMQRDDNEFGFTNKVDTHIMKNMEWGAVAYLTNSKYGKNSEVWINNNSNRVTGCVGKNAMDYQEIDCINSYNTLIGVNGSTTGNIYGIYDMVGGNIEYVMGAMYNSNNQTITISDRDCGFNQSTIDSAAMSKYMDKNIYGTTFNDQTAFNRRLLGDATGETVNWNEDVSMFVIGNTWFQREGE